MEVKDNNMCFVCGKNNPDGLHLVINRDEKTLSAWAETAVPDKFCGWTGIAHGGILTTLLDEVMAFATFTHDQRGVTGEISARFEKPVMCGKTIRIEGHVVSTSGRVSQTEGVILVDGAVHVRGSAKMVALKTE